MSMKKTDLVKNLAKKLDGRMKSAGVPGRFGQGANEVVDKREQRRRDSAAGLVPFACKLPGELVKRLNEKADGQEGGVNLIVMQAIEAALGAKSEGIAASKAAPAEGAAELAKPSAKSPDKVPAKAAKGAGKGAPKEAEA